MSLEDVPPESRALAVSQSTPPNVKSTARTARTATETTARTATKKTAARIPIKSTTKSRTMSSQVPVPVKSPNKRIAKKSSHVVSADQTEVSAMALAALTVSTKHNDDVLRSLRNNTKTNSFVVPSSEQSTRLQTSQQWLQHAICVGMEEQGVFIRRNLYKINRHDVWLKTHMADVLALKPWVTHISWLDRKILCLEEVARHYAFEDHTSRGETDDIIDTVAVKEFWEECSPQYDALITSTKCKENPLSLYLYHRVVWDMFIRLAATCIKGSFKVDKFCHVIYQLLELIGVSMSTDADDSVNMMKEHPLIGVMFNEFFKLKEKFRFRPWKGQNHENHLDGFVQAQIRQHHGKTSGGHIPTTVFEQHYAAKNMASDDDSESFAKLRCDLMTDATVVPPLDEAVINEVLLPMSTDETMNLILKESYLLRDDTTLSFDAVRKNFSGLGFCYRTAVFRLNVDSNEFFLNCMKYLAINLNKPGLARTLIKFHEMLLDSEFGARSAGNMYWRVIKFRIDSSLLYHGYDDPFEEPNDSSTSKPTVEENENQKDTQADENQKDTQADVDEDFSLMSLYNDPNDAYDDRSTDNDEMKEGCDEIPEVQVPSQVLTSSRGAFSLDALIDDFCAVFAGGAARWRMMKSNASQVRLDKIKRLAKDNYVLFRMREWETAVKSNPRMCSDLRSWENIEYAATQVSLMNTAHTKFQVLVERIVDDALANVDGVKRSRKYWDSMNDIDVQSIMDRGLWRDRVLAVMKKKKLSYCNARAEEAILSLQYELGGGEAECIRNHEAALLLDLSFNRASQWYQDITDYVESKLLTDETEDFHIQNDDSYYCHFIKAKKDLKVIAEVKRIKGEDAYNLATPKTRATWQYDVETKKFDVEHLALRFAKQKAEENAEACGDTPWYASMDVLKVDSQSKKRARLDCETARNGAMKLFDSEAAALSPGKSFKALDVSQQQYVRINATIKYHNNTRNLAEYLDWVSSEERLHDQVWKFITSMPHETFLNKFGSGMEHLRQQAYRPIDQKTWTDPSQFCEVVDVHEMFENPSHDHYKIPCACPYISWCQVAVNLPPHPRKPEHSQASQMRLAFNRLREHNDQLLLVTSCGEGNCFPISLVVGLKTGKPEFIEKYLHLTPQTARKEICDYMEDNMLHLIPYCDGDTMSLLEWFAVEEKLDLRDVDGMTQGYKKMVASMRIDKTWANTTFVKSASLLYEFDMVITASDYGKPLRHNYYPDSVASEDRHVVVFVLVGAGTDYPHYMPTVWEETLQNFEVLHKIVYDKKLPESTRKKTSKAKPRLTKNSQEAAASTVADDEP